MNGISGMDIRKNLETTTGIEPVEVQLQRRRDHMQQQIEDMDRAIALLKEQPQLLETLNLLRRVGI